NMSRMRVKGDWENVVEFYSMGLGMVRGRRGEGMWKGNVLVYGIVWRKRQEGIDENFREVEPGFVGWGGRLRSPTGWTKNYSDGRDPAQDYLLIEYFEN